MGCRPTGTSRCGPASKSSTIRAATRTCTRPMKVRTGYGSARCSAAVLLAWHLRELNMLTSPHLRNDSLLLLRRSVPERVRRIAPFLQLDRDPYLVVADGRLVWIVDAYTTTDRIPYAQPVTEIIAENMALQPTDLQAAGASQEVAACGSPGGSSAAQGQIVQLHSQQRQGRG